MLRHITDRDRDNLSAEIASLEVIDAAALKQRWRALYGTQPPPRISRETTKATARFDRYFRRSWNRLRASTRLRSLEPAWHSSRS